MNVLHLTHTDISSDSRILKEMQSLASADTQYTVSGIGVTLDEGAHASETIDNIEIHSIILQSRNFKCLPAVVRHLCSLFELTFKMFFKAIRLRPKIVHCNDTLVLPLGVLVKLLLRSKLIYDAHELESDRNGLTTTLARLTLFAEKILWRFVDALIVVSPSIEKWYKDNVGAKYSEVILNSPVLETDGRQDGYDYLRKHFSIASDSKIFLYVGILGHGRGIDLLVNVFKEADLSSSLIFLGYGEMAESLKDISVQYPNIYVHDAVPHERVVSIAKSADVGLCLIQNVSLSDYYCLPNKLFEYSFAGLPILASDFPDISRAVESYGLGRCCKLDKKSIYQAVKDLENSVELPNINVECLYDLSWEAQEKKLKHLYSNLSKK